MITENISSSETSRPFVIYGPSGCGKTSLVAKIAYDLHSSKTGTALNVVRFIGTSAMSCAVQDLLCSISLQLCEAAQMEPPKADVLENFSNITSFFNKTLRRLSKRSQSAVIILDSLDQLSPADNAFNLNWLPVVLPNGIRVVVSTIPDSQGILDRLQKLVGDPNQFLEVSQLTEDTADTILDMWLSTARRMLTLQQRKLVREAFRNCQRPLFLRYVMSVSSFIASREENKVMTIV